ncbi:DMT family transporter [Reichenbachiella agarivorans]|uniref:DMT family transporter n=1 Tax=Reichenbachiella agarivorans TaxID=2979464 RepID=A0ABY6CU43_9BACT|nr:DMT family transporter [Reichenbachiella agarivorans]UXP34036.1 DMT family transporter [Reichenbachiella agarivorans]
MDKRIFQFLQLGMAILVMSSSGTLARYIHLSPEVIIWARCAVGAVALFIFLKLAGMPTYIGWGKSFRMIVISTVLMAGHWIAYFYGLKFTSVAIGMLSLHTYPVITALLEPVMMGHKHKMTDILIAVLAFSGVFFLVPEFDLNNDITLGIVCGVVSAVFYSVRNIMLKQNITEHSGITLMYYQLLIIALFMWPVLYIGDFGANITGLTVQWQPLLVLGLATTALGHTLFVMSFRYFSITAISIMSSMTPLCGIIIGYLVLVEVPEGKVLLGGAIILASVVIESIRASRIEVRR